MRAVVLAWCWFAALLTGDVAAAHDLPGNARIVEYDSPAAGLRLKYTKCPLLADSGRRERVR